MTDLRDEMLRRISDSDDDLTQAQINHAADAALELMAEIKPLTPEQEILETLKEIEGWLSKIYRYGSPTV